MKWEDVQLESRIWRVPGASTKNGETQIIELTSREIDVLVRRAADRGSSPYVLPGKGKTGHYVEPKRAWATLLANAGIKDKVAPIGWANF
jgi:integrase